MIVYDDVAYDEGIPRMLERTSISSDESDSLHIRSNFEEIWIYETFNK